ncbi:MAG TPA: cell division protein FtsQ/DivIB [Rhizomicrobium sp.]|nr:cell division protein FtsQ/DivIB [Rhizomicrobium sp.]
MRSVSVERKSRKASRTQTARPSSRGGREMPSVQPGSARRGKGPGLLTRLSDRLSLFTRRPIIVMSGLLTVLVLLGALFASGVIGRGVRAVDRTIDTITADAGFGISEIHITGNRRTPYNQVLEVLAMKPGQSIFSADLWQGPADAHGEALIWVVERNGKLITTRDVEKFRRLPKLVGAGAPEAAADLVDAVATHRAITARIAAYSRVSMRRWNLILDDGVVVQLPDSGWQKELDALERLIIDGGILERDITQIDLRSPTHYFFLLKNGEKKDAPRGKET